MKALFELGQLRVTRGAFEEMGKLGIDFITLLGRHQGGDWSEMEKEDQVENQLSVKEGFRVFSAYTFATIKFWVITEADRSYTTILLPEEY